MKRILHLITSLDPGGWEMVLYRLLAELTRDDGYEWHAVSLLPAGSVGDRIRELGIEVSDLGMRRGISDVAAVVRLARLIRQSRPDLVQTWMYHANLLGSAVARMPGAPPMVWTIGHVNLNPAYNKARTLKVVRLGARLSRLVPRAIVFDSQAALEAHAAVGYAPERLSVIHSGFDTSRFKPDPQARASLRLELGIPAEAPVVGLMGRFHPQKDHKTFFAAMELVWASEPKTHVILAGTGVTRDNDIIARWLGQGPFNEHVHVLGQREDMPRLMAALDVAVSSSVGESFPNTVGEAMACGVPCAVTDVGDSALLVGDTGRVVACRNHKALAGAVCELIELGPEGRRDLGQRARARVKEHWAMPEAALRWRALYERVCGVGVAGVGVAEVGVAEVGVAVAAGDAQSRGKGGSDGEPSEPRLPRPGDKDHPGGAPKQPRSDAAKRPATRKDRQQATRPRRPRR